MLVLFCLRLACGLVGCLLLLSPAQVNPRFYRVHFLTALGLTAVALLFSWQAAEPWLLAVLGGALFVCYLGSIVWSLDNAPGGVVCAILGTVGLSVGLLLAERGAGETPHDEGLAHAAYGWRAAGDLASAALLGAATTAMLMGHSYLIAPAMSLTPLLRLLAALGAATILRMGLAGFALWSWTAGHSPSTLTGDMQLWLPVRWGLGFAAPLVLNWMAWQSARIRSTQSATGILYVIVIFCFLGELISQLLLGSTGFTL